MILLPPVLLQGHYLTLSFFSQIRTGYVRPVSSLIDIIFENVHFCTRATFVGRLIYGSYLPLAHIAGVKGTLVRLSVTPLHVVDELINVLSLIVPAIAKNVNIFFELS